MTDDLDHLKTALQAATPKPDSARRTADIAAAQAQFAKLHDVAKPARKSLWHRWMSGGGFAAAAASTAVVVMGVFIVSQPNTPPVQTKTAAEPAIAERAIERRSADFATAELTMAAPAGVSAGIQMDDMQQPLAALRLSLAQGTLPPAGTVTLDPILNEIGLDLPLAQINALPLRAAATGVVAPWDDRLYLVLLTMDSAAPATVQPELPRFQARDTSARDLAPGMSLVTALQAVGQRPTHLRLEVTSAAPVTLAISDAGIDARFAVAVAGFVAVLDDPAAFGPWGFDDLIDFATVNRGDDPDGTRAEIIALMRMAQAL